MNKYTLVTLSLLLAFWASPVFAYIDPGSGSAIMSAVIGFFLAISIAIKTYWYKLRSLFGFGKSNTVSDSKASEEDIGSDKGEG